MNELDDAFSDKIKNLTEGDDDDLELDDGEGDSEEEMGMYDKKEEEARAEVQEMFGELIEKIERTRGAIEELMHGDTVFVAGKYRVKVTKEVMGKVETMVELNENIQQANVYLKGYIDIGELMPKFDFIKNLIFKFQESLMREQGRRFAILRKENRGEYYITKGLIDYYLKGIHAHLSRIIGDLEAVGDYIVTVPPKRESPVGMEGGVNDYGGYVGQYVNEDRWWDRNRGIDAYVPGTRVNPGEIREFGDKKTK